jgi:hypothetical protein
VPGGCAHRDADRRQPGTATAIAAELGVDEFRAELLPEDKVAAVEELRRKHGSVAMVGDGVNDAGAGVRRRRDRDGRRRGDAALETADIALMADELLRIPYVPPELRHCQEHQDEPGDLRRAEGGVRRGRGGRRGDARMAVLADTGAS